MNRNRLFYLLTLSVFLFNGCTSIPQVDKGSDPISYKAPWEEGPTLSAGGSRVFYVKELNVSQAIGFSEYSIPEINEKSFVTCLLVFPNEHTTALPYAMEESDYSLTHYSFSVMAPTHKIKIEWRNDYKHSAMLNRNTAIGLPGTHKIIISITSKPEKGTKAYYLEAQNFCGAAGGSEYLFSEINSTSIVECYLIFSDGHMKQMPWSMVEADNSKTMYTFSVTPLTSRCKFEWKNDRGNAASLASSIKYLLISIQN
jgi:hypothetical protein